MKKIVLALAVVMLIAFPIFANGAQEKAKEVSICTPYMSSVTTKQDVDIMTAEFEKAGIKVSTFDSANDFCKLASDIETATVSGTGAIIIVSVDPNLVSAQIQEAANAGSLLCR